jgi:hypothetical protein
MLIAGLIGWISFMNESPQNESSSSGSNAICPMMLGTT